MPALALAACAVLLVVGCGTGSATPGALGLESPPPGLDPASPSLAARDVAFTATDVDVPAGRPFYLVFENRESLPHNVSIYADAAATTRLFEGISFSGPATRWYPVPALPAGAHVFRCDLHPNMTGRLRAT